MGENAYSLDHCNHKKDNWFDFSLCVSPVENEIESLFGFRCDGKIYALGSNFNYVADTIEYYRQKDETGRYTPFCSMITFCLEHELMEVR